MASDNGEVVINGYGEGDGRRAEQPQQPVGFANVVLPGDMAEDQHQHQQDRRKDQRHQRQRAKAAIQALVGKVDDNCRNQAQQAYLKVSHASAC